jgi:filamentous hemagglutinin family protein
MRFTQYYFIHLLGGLGAIGLLAVDARAQSLIVPDNTLGSERSIVVPGLGFETIQGGATRGAGLFHSFSEFNVGDRANVQFAVQPEIQNIFARVTGSNGSQILGTLGTGVVRNGVLGDSAANLFLLNPNGILFGPNAKLDLAGSFLATTASSFRFAEGKEFGAVNPQVAPLLTISTPIGLQFGSVAGEIELKGITTALETANNRSFILAGGPINLVNSRLNSKIGNVEIGAIGSGEFVGLTSGSAAGFQLDYRGVGSFQDVVIDRSQVGIVSVSDEPTVVSDLRIQGRDIALTNQSQVLHLHGFASRSDRTVPGSITLNAARNIDLESSTLGGLSFDAGEIFQLLGVPVPPELANASSSAANININAQNLKLRNVSSIGTKFTKQGTGGNISIQVRDDLTIQNAGSYIVSDNASRGTLDGGNISVSAGTLNLINGGSIVNGLTGQGKAGDITIDVRGAVNLLGDGFLPDSVVFNDAFLRESLGGGQRYLPSTISSNTGLFATGSTGNIKISAGSLQIAKGGAIIAVNIGKGDTGIIDLRVSGSATVTGISENAGSPSQIYNTSFGLPPGVTVGNLRSNTTGIQISAQSLEIDRGGFVSTRGILNTASKGIQIDVQDTVRIQGGDSFINQEEGSQTFYTSQISTSKASGVGNPGNIKIRARGLEVLKGGLIESNVALAEGVGDVINPIPIQTISPGTFQGQTGDIEIITADYALVDGVDADADPSRISSSVEPTGNAQGGKISIQTKDLAVTNGGQILSTLSGDGKAGEIAIAASGEILVAGSGPRRIVGSNSRIASNLTVSAVGDGGKITVVTDRLRLRSGGSLSTSNNNAIGDGGDISVNANDISIGGRSRFGDESGIFTGVSNLPAGGRLRDVEKFDEVDDLGRFIPREGIGNSGNIAIVGGDLRLTGAGSISARNLGRGNAGTISIQLDNKLIARNASISSISSQNSGGNVDVAAKVVVLRDSNITTQVGRGGGSGGNIQLKADSAVVLTGESNLLAFSRDGRGGNITLLTPALLARIYNKSIATNLNNLESNGLVDINASGRISGVITLPEFNPLQNNRPEFTPSLIDTDKILSRSCLVRNPNTGTFVVTGTGGLPPRPGDRPLSTYSTLPVGAETPIAEADNLYTLANGQVVIGKACQAVGEKS